MELRSVHKTFHHMGDEKHQMLNLNHRLESYLSRVKLLEEENALLAKEIQALRCSGHGAVTKRKCLEEELQQARLELDGAWRDRACTELEVCRLTEVLQTLDLQRQKEAQAQKKAKMKLEQSRKELEEEQRAQIWLREKVSQLEHEMRHLIQTHQEDVAHLEATLTQSRTTMPPTLPQRGNQKANFLQLGQEYSQSATRAWQEAAEAYQGQLARLEESLSQARGRLTQVFQEKSESQLKLKALEKEITSAQDIKLHLEKTVSQQGQKYSQEIQQLQEHLAGLEAEREELGQQNDRLLHENRDLLQVKMSLGLEVATYRALLDSESLRGDTTLLNQPRNISITDAVFSPQGVKKNYQTRVSPSHKATSFPSVRGKPGTMLTSVTATPAWSRKPVACTEAVKMSTPPAFVDTTQAETWKTPYPKILQDEVIENFRPQEVHETVSHAEPLSPPNEQEVLAETTSEVKEGAEDWGNVGAKLLEEGPVVEGVVSSQVESVLSTEPPFKDEVTQQQLNTPNLTPYHIMMKEEACGFSDEPEKDVPEPHAPVVAWEEKEGEGKEEEHVQEETSDSETEAVIEPNFESRTSSPVSEYEPEDGMFNKVADVSRDEDVVKEDVVELRQETSCSIKGTCEMDAEDKLYPDGEEMDTWDSVIEKKVDLKTCDGTKKDEEKQQHAEQEEDISTLEQEHEKRETRQELNTHKQQDETVDTPMIDTQKDEEGPPAVLDVSDNEEDDEEEDSQNVSVSWRTELESESYVEENTLADTRPLIRYKSDETDANTQASHMDESESSGGELEKKVGEMEPWVEGKAKRFGTMEDLCEEGEGEALDEEYDLGYTYTEDRDAGCGKAEPATAGNDEETAEERMRDVSEGHLEVETEEPNEPMAPTHVDYDEELEIDRLVEQELENLDTDSYSAHFAQKQANVSEKMLDTQHKSNEKIEEEDTFPSGESEVKVNQELTSTTAITDQPYGKLDFSDASATDPELQPKDQDAPEKRQEEDEHNISMVTHADETENHSGFTDFLIGLNVKESTNSSEPNPALLLAADQGSLQDVTDAAPMETYSVSQEHPIEDASDCQQVLETAGWEVLENPSEDFDIRDQNPDYEESDHLPESAESPLHDNGGIEQSLMTPPFTVPDDIFVVKDSTDVLKKNDKDGSLHAFFSSTVKSDYWVSSLETGATNQSEDSCNETAEQTNQNLGFAGNSGNLVWGDLENPNEWNSSLDIDSSKALVAKKEQELMHSEVKQVFCRNAVEGEMVHSEESDAEAESWSSGEEPV